MRRWRTDGFGRRRHVAAALALLVVALAAGSPSRSSAESPPAVTSSFSPAKLAHIGDYFRNEITTGKIPGAILLIQQHGHPVYFENFGVRDVATRHAMTPDTIFRLYSMSKPITSVAAMMLVEDGKLSLGDPVSKYIPAFADVKVGVEKPDETGKPMLVLKPVKRPITVEDLLRQTSGITYGFYGDSAVRKLYAHSDLFDGDFDNAQFVARLAKLPLAEQPETVWDYGHSTDVLGRVIEVASGQSLFAFEKQRLLDPLGMTDTAFYVADAAKRPLLAEPLPDDRFVSPVAGIRDPMLPRRWESGGAGMVGTIGDYARFAQMLLNGGTLDGRRYLKSETVAAMTSDHIGLQTHIAHDYFYFPGDGSGFGLGFAVRTAQAAETPSPPGEYRWDGVAGTFFFIDPHDDMFVICMMQSPSQRGRIETAVKDLVYQALTPPALGGDQRAEPEFAQPQPVFAKAIRNRSTHTYVIFATVVNDKTGEIRTGCMAANFLLGAIRRQYDLDSSVASQQKAIQIALQTSPRVFHFSKQAAIDNLPSLGDAPSAKRWRDNFQAKYQKACSLVKQGRSVFLADITGQIRVEP